MIRTQIYLPEELLMQIKLEAQMQKINMSELIRQLLIEILKKNKTEQKRLSLTSISIKSGGFNCKPEELSEEIDKIVYDL